MLTKKMNLSKDIEQIMFFLADFRFTAFDEFLVDSEDSYRVGNSLQPISTSENMDQLPPQKHTPDYINILH